MLEVALPLVKKMLPTKTFVYQKCLKKGEIVEEAVKEELTKLCVKDRKSVV